MLGENLAALLLLYVRPVEAMSRILDRGRLWFAIVITLIVSVVASIADPASLIVQSLMNSVNQAELDASHINGSPRAGEQVQQPPEPPQRAPEPALRRLYFFHSIFFSSVWSIVVLLVPGMIAIRALLGHGSFGVLMRQDYLSMLICTLLGWSAAYLPAAAIAFAEEVAQPGAAALRIVLPLFAISVIYFLILTWLAARTAFGISGGFAAGLTAAGAVVSIVGGTFFGVIGVSAIYLASPLFLLYGWRLFASDFRSLGDGLRSRQHFQQQLEIATNNPRDADAHYQLGLIYQRRRQFSEAIARFQRAVEIDPNEADPHFQLGVIARTQERFDDAIRELKKAASLNDKLQQSDVWRELGAALFGAGNLDEAVAALAKFTDRRPYDPEGLYWYGKTLKKLGRAAEAREMFERAIEAVKTMPKHRRAEVRQWGGKSKSEL
jgi:tetratricopeptide (TPR) repeat protein